MQRAVPEHACARYTHACTSSSEAAQEGQQPLGPVLRSKSQMLQLRVSHTGELLLMQSGHPALCHPSHAACMHAQLSAAAHEGSSRLHRSKSQQLHPRV